MCVLFVCVRVDTIPEETRKPDMTAPDQEPEEPNFDLRCNENVDDGKSTEIL